MKSIYILSLVLLLAACASGPTYKDYYESCDSLTQDCHQYAQNICLNFGCRYE